MQLVIISGKGGTGKTTIAGSFSWLADESIKADCDVDAANLHLLLGGEDQSSQPFVGAKVALIDERTCTACGRCSLACRFGAISGSHVNELKCEGCGACAVICPAQAISLVDQVTGRTIITTTGKGLLSRAEMEIGAEGSGKLVTEVRKNVRVHRTVGQMVILDGSPGIGCAVMASLTGVDAALIVVEPTVSGIADFERVAGLAEQLGVRVLVCINKHDLNTTLTERLELFCAERSLPLVGEVPFDPQVNLALHELKPVVAYPDAPAAQEIIAMWGRIKNQFEEEVQDENSSC